MQEVKNYLNKIKTTLYNLDENNSKKIQLKIGKTLNK